MKVFQVRQIKEFLKLLVGGIVVKTKGWYFGGISALRKVMSRKRIPLCGTHFMMMEEGKLCFSNLSVTDKLQ